jgi:hypothetical protein
MSQNDFNLANQGFPSMRADINSALQALATNSSGATGPSTTYAYQWWYDTTANILKIRNAANSAWIDFASFDQGAGTWSLNITGGTIDGATIGATTPSTIAGTTGSFSSGLSLASVPVFAGDPQNLIINGAFDFWQRGTSSSGGGYVAADRWANGFVNGTVTQSRQSFTLGDTLGSNSPTYFLRQTVSGQSAAGDLAVTVHRIEGVRSYAGQTITVLGWARRSSGSGNMVVEAEQDFGTGGSPSAVVNAIGPTTVALTSSWQPFAAVMAVPSIAGKTLGSNNNNFLALDFWTSAGSNWNSRTNSLGLQTIGVDLWGIHIKEGVHAVEAVDGYRAPELGPELARCQRYFYKPEPEIILRISGYGSAGGQPITAANVTFPVTMRKAPTVVSSTSSNVNVTIGGQSATSAGVTQGASTAASGPSTYLFTFTSADAEL